MGTLNDLDFDLLERLIASENQPEKLVEVLQLTPADIESVLDRDEITAADAAHLMRLKAAAERVAARRPVQSPQLTLAASGLGGRMLSAEQVSSEADHMRVSFHPALVGRCLLTDARTGTTVVLYEQQRTVDLGDRPHPRTQHIQIFAHGKRLSITVDDLNYSIFSFSVEMDAPAKSVLTFVMGAVTCPPCSDTSL